MNKKQNGNAAVAAVGIVAALVMVVLAVYGYVANIVQLVHIASNPVTGLFILKCVGIPVAPLGVILGFIGV